MKLRNVSLAASLLLVMASAILWRSNAQNAVPLQSATLDSTSSTSATPIPKATPALTCTLTIERTTYTVGEVPLMRVKIRNNLPNPIYLVGRLDGSDYRMRYPYCYFDVIDSAGRKPPPMFRGCGNVDELQVRDLVQVEPNSYFDPSISHYDHLYNNSSQQTTGYRFPIAQLSNDPRIFGSKTTFIRPGTYKVRFVYSTQSPSFDEWQANKDSEPLSEPLFKQIPRVTIESNTVTLRFVPAKKPVRKQQKPQV